MMSSGAGRQLASQLGQAGFRLVQQRRRRKIKNNQWVLGSRIMGLPFDPNSTIRARRRRRRNGRNGGGAQFNGFSTRGVNTTVSQPVTYGHTTRRVVAPMNRPETGNEELAIVTQGPAEGAYFSMSFSINPAESTTFARLATLATQYQRYTFKSIQLTYTPFMGTGQTGEIAITMAPDPTHPEPKNMTELMGLFGAVRGPVNLPLSYSVPASLFSKALNQYMMKSMLTPGPDDDNVINSVGRFYVAVQNVTGAVFLPVGRLAISYELVLNDPVTQPEGATYSGEIDFTGKTAGTYTSDDVSAYEDGDRNVRPCWYDTTFSMWRTRARIGHLLILSGVRDDANISAFTVTCYQSNPAGEVLAAVGTLVIPNGEVSTKTISMYKLPLGARFTIANDSTLSTFKLHVYPCVHDITAL